MVLRRFRKQRNMTDEEKDRELKDLQLKEYRMSINRMEKENAMERRHKVSSIVRRAGSFAIKSIAPSNSMTMSEYNERMTRYPSEMFDASKAFGNSSSKVIRGKKIQYIRRVR